MPSQRNRMIRYENLLREFQYNRVCFHNNYSDHKIITVFLINDKTRRYLVFSTGFHNSVETGYGSFSFFERKIEEPRLTDGNCNVYMMLPQNKLSSFKRMFFDKIVPNHQIPSLFQCRTLEEAIEIASNNRRNQTRIREELTSEARDSIQILRRMNEINQEPAHSVGYL